MKKTFLSLCCLLAIVSCGQKKGQAADSVETDNENNTEQAEADGEGDHALTLLRLFNKQHKTDLATMILKGLEGQWGTKEANAYLPNQVDYVIDDEWLVEVYVAPDTKAETISINMLGEDTEGTESMQIHARPKKDSAWWCFVAYRPGEDYPQYYSYELLDGKLKPAKSPLDTYQKTHESMDAMADPDILGKTFEIMEYFPATYTLQVNQSFSWDGEHFTLEEIKVNNGLEEENKACFLKLEKDAFGFDKFALVPAGGTLCLLLSDDAEDGQALFNLGPYDSDEMVQMLLCTSRVYGIFSFKYFEHGIVQEQSCGSGCRSIDYVLMDHWNVSHRLSFSVGFDDYDEATDTYQVAGDVSYELDDKALDETEGEQMRHQIVSELGKQLEVEPKWIKIGKQ